MTIPFSHKQGGKEKGLGGQIQSAWASKVARYVLIGKSHQAFVKICKMTFPISCHNFTRQATTWVNMKTNVEVELEKLEIQSDTSLVELSLAGDHDAFGRIVSRYQSSICALAYCACGNVGRSEEIAQEIFITAWRKLGTLQEPARFRAWLYGIARNLIHNAFRRHTRSPLADAKLLGEGIEPAADSAEPDEQAISKEEETILWHVLSGLPVIYREPMVLFYRQNESIPQVAGVLEISEEAVRQRLSRGRALLNERVTKVIQTGLRRSGPADTFAIAVIAALPIVAATTTAKGAIVGMATTKSGHATGLAGLLKGIGFFAGLIAIPATLGTLFGYKLGRDATGLPQHRKSVRKFWLTFGGGLVLFLFLPLLLTFGVTGFMQGEARARFLSVMTVWLGLAYLLVPGSLLVWAWQRRRDRSHLNGNGAAGQGEPISEPVENFRPGIVQKISRRLVLFLTVAAAGLLVFCYLDMNHNVGHLTGAGLRDLINQGAPDNLKVSIMEGHNRSIWREYPTMYRHFWVEVGPGGKTAKYTADVDETTLALIAQKGISCRTYVAGRDYEVLGTPGRMLPFLAAFILGISIIYLLKRRPAGPATK
jgi:RNA polymerase sigma factor (sigma-70 family)